VQCFPTAISREHYPYPTMCQSTGTTLGVDASGDVSFCRRIQGPRPENGNVLRDGAAVWYNAAAKALREAHDDNPAALPARCRACFGAWSG
jgi:radical SAM protein with 4Fe4S-binding SPASM domain